MLKSTIDKSPQTAKDKQHPFDTALLQLASSASIIALRLKTDTHIATANQFLKKHQFKEAALEYEAAIQCNKDLLKQPGLPEPKKREIQLTLIVLNGRIARYYRELNDFDKAFKHIAAAIDRCTTHHFEHIIWFYFMQRAQLYLLTKKPADIEKAYTEFTFARLQPQYLHKLAEPSRLESSEADHLIRELIPTINATIQQAWLENRLHDVIKFTPIYIELIENNPLYSQISLYFNLALAHQALGQYPEALTALNKSFGFFKQEDHGMFYKLRATLYKDMGQFKEARADMLSAMKYIKYDYELIKLKKTLDTHFQSQPKPASKKKKVDISHTEEAKQPAATTTPIATVPAPTPEPEPLKINEKKPEVPVIKKNPELAQKKALKKQQKKQKKELAERNRQHQQAIAYSKNIMQQLLDNVVQLAEKKQQKEAARYAERRTAFKSIAASAACSATLQQARKSVMTQRQFADLCALNDKINAHGAKLRIYGSSVFAFQFPGIKNNDIDIQLYDITPQNRSAIINVLAESRYTHKRTGSQNEYMQFESMSDHKPIEATVILEAKCYSEHYDPINITHAGLVIQRNALNQPYLALDEHGELLLSAQKKGYFDVNLSHHLQHATCLFARMIKYSSLLEGILHMRIITGHASWVLSKHSWNHPAWTQWLNYYFEKGVMAGGDAKASCYKEIIQLIKKSYLERPEAEYILFAFCRALLLRSSYINNPISTHNMTQVLRYFYQRNSGDFYTTTDHYIYLTKHYPILQAKILNATEISITSDKLVAANKLNTKMGYHINGAYQTQYAPRLG